MIKYTKLFITLILAVIAFEAKSQSTATTSSPYSQYGLGDLTPLALPQNLAMGGISTAVNQINGYSSINPLNPASYAAIHLTAIDIGLYGNTVNLSQNGQPTQRNSNFRINHMAFGIPITRGSAVSFGLLPYSELGYNYAQIGHGFGTGAANDTATVRRIFNGEGGLSKAYIGYGFSVGRNLYLGFNVGYIFGDLKHYRTIETPTLAGALNAKFEDSYRVGGLNYDFGAQYSIDLSLTRRITFAYSASAKSAINSKNNYIVSEYFVDAQGNANVAVDSVISQTGATSKIQLPMINHFGVSYQRDQKYLIGVDYSIGNWSALTIGGVNQNMANRSTLNIGGQITPDINAINNYWATVDYRFGAILDNTYYNIANPSGTGYTNIKSTAITFGLGLPLRSTNTSYYKINLSAELGQRGTTNNGLVKENFINIRIGFTLNDKWFQRYKFD